MTFCISPMKRVRWIGPASLLLATLLVPAAADTQCPPVFQSFTARYDLYRNGDALGTTTVTLQRSDQGAWEYRLESRAQGGLYGFLGAGYEESSRWMPASEHLMPLEFRREQHVAFSDRSYEAHFDWTAKQVQGRARDREWQFDDLTLGTLDRLLVNLALIRDLRCGRDVLSYRVLEKGELETWRFDRRGKTTVETPQGEYDTVKVAKRHDSPDRVSLSWHAPALGWLAVRIEHQDDADEDRFAMVLRELER